MSARSRADGATRRGGRGPSMRSRTRAGGADLIAGSLKLLSLVFELAHSRRPCVGEPQRFTPRTGDSAASRRRAAQSVRRTDELRLLVHANRLVQQIHRLVVGATIAPSHGRTDERRHAPLLKRPARSSECAGANTGPGSPGSLAPSRLQSCTMQRIRVSLDGLLDGVFEATHSYTRAIYT